MSVQYVDMFKEKKKKITRTKKNLCSTLVLATHFPCVMLVLIIQTFGIEVYTVFCNIYLLG